MISFCGVSDQVGGAPKSEKGASCSACLERPSVYTLSVPHHEDLADTDPHLCEVVCF